jgi:hypothetical protein
VNEPSFENLLSFEERPLKHITSKYKELEDTLWQTALVAAGEMEIRPGGENAVRAWITIGIQRMERQGRLASEDLRLAHINMRKLIDLLKTEAVFLGKPDQIDGSAFHAARRRLRRQASLITFTLWPFWPYNFVLTN